MSATGASAGVPGESASRAILDRITTAIDSVAAVEKIVHLRAVHLSPEDLFVAARVALAADRTLVEAAEDIAAIKESIRGSVPRVQALYVEPDIYRPSMDPTPSTDVFVLKSAD